MGGAGSCAPFHWSHDFWKVILEGMKTCMNLSKVEDIINSGSTIKMQPPLSACVKAICLEFTAFFSQCKPSSSNQLLFYT